MHSLYIPETSLTLNMNLNPYLTLNPNPKLEPHPKTSGPNHTKVNHYNPFLTILSHAPSPPCTVMLYFSKPNTFGTVSVLEGCAPGRLTQNTITVILIAVTVIMTVAAVGVGIAAAVYVYKKNPVHQK